MPYRARLINRLAQHGRASYDLVVEDDAGRLPPLRHSVSLPLAEDTAETRTRLRGRAERDAEEEQRPESRRARLRELRDALDAQREALKSQRDEIQGKIDRDEV